MEIVLSLNRNWIYDTYFSLCRAIDPGGKVRGEISGYMDLGSRIVLDGCTCCMELHVPSSCRLVASSQH